MTDAVEYKPPLRIVAFDLGIHFAVATNIGGPAEVQRVDFKDPATRNGMLMQMLRTLIEQAAGAIDVVILERPFGSKFVAADKVLFGQAAIIDAVFMLAGIPVLSLVPADIKRRSTGKGNADKAMMLAAAKRQGYAGTDEHCADAWCLLKVGEATIISKPAKGLKP